MLCILSHITVIIDAPPLGSKLLMLSNHLSDWKDMPKYSCPTANSDILSPFKWKLHTASYGQVCYTPKKEKQDCQEENSDAAVSFQERSAGQELKVLPDIIHLSSVYADKLGPHHNYNFTGKRPQLSKKAESSKNVWMKMTGKIFCS